MSEIPLCSIVISSKLPRDEIELLETSLGMNSIKVQKSPSRVVGADDILFLLAVIGGIDATTNLIAKLAKVLNDWRRKLKEKGIEPQVHRSQKYEIRSQKFYLNNKVRGFNSVDPRSTNKRSAVEMYLFLPAISRRL